MSVCYDLVFFFCGIIRIIFLLLLLHIADNQLYTESDPRL